MYEKIPLTGMDHAKWLCLRKTGIGGSDAGAICGVNPYSSAMKVFRDKTGEVAEEQDNEAIRIGHDLEDYVAKRFMEATGLKVRKSNFMYRSVEHPSPLYHAVLPLHGGHREADMVYCRCHSRQGIYLPEIRVGR